MELIGKKIIRTATAQAVNPAMFIDAEKGNLKFNNAAAMRIGLFGAEIGFGYEEGKVSLYKAEEGQGVKVSTAGSVGSKFHATAILSCFNILVDETSKDKIEFTVDVEGFEHPEYPGMTFYTVTPKQQAVVATEAPEESMEELQERFDDSVADRALSQQEFSEEL